MVNLEMLMSAEFCDIGSQWFICEFFL